MDSIELEVYCQHCGQRIWKPADCEMEAFRLGYQLHSGNCFETFIRQLNYEERAGVRNHFGRPTNGGS